MRKYKRLERFFQDRFTDILGGEYRQYVSCSTGIIDVLTVDGIYELKPILNVTSLKTAIGQLCVYALEYPFHKKYIVCKRNKLSDSMMEYVNKLNIQIIIV